MMTLSDQSMLCTIFSSTHMSWISLHNTWTETVINTVRVCMYSMYVWHSLHANGIGNMPDNQYFGVPSCKKVLLDCNFTFSWSDMGLPKLGHTWPVIPTNGEYGHRPDLWEYSGWHPYILITLCSVLCLFCFFMQLICSTARPINYKEYKQVSIS